MPNSDTSSLPDGLRALLAELELREVMGLIERTARWVAPETFRLLPAWYPEYARRSHFYKGNWSQPQMNRNRTTGLSVHKQEGNLYANKALTHALGLRSDGRTNWSCCHLWGADDSKYQEANVIVQDRRFYSCVGNMVLLPTPLKAFTDTIPAVKTMLRICARNLYGWYCDHESTRSAVATMNDWDDWNAFPKSWPKSKAEGEPRGVVTINDGIRQSAARRLERIRNDLERAGPHYPREEVYAVLAYWHIAI